MVHSDQLVAKLSDLFLTQIAGEGVDLIVDSLSGDAITKGLEILRPGGRFVEIGAAGVVDPPAVDPKRRYKDKTGMVAAVLEIRAGTAEPVQKKRKGKVSRESLKSGSHDQLVGS